MDHPLTPTEPLDRVLLGCYAFMVEDLRELRTVGYTREEAVRSVARLETLQHIPAERVERLIDIVARVSVLMWARPYLNADDFRTSRSAACKK